MEIRDRIKEFKRVPASELIPNPKNWRRHSEYQSQALQGMLTEVGYADAVIAYETKDGLQLIDGHLRVETTPDTLIPVIVTDLNEEEADKVLATLDPLSALASTDSIALADLLKDLSFDDSTVMDMLQTITAESETDMTRLWDAPDEFQTFDEDIATDYQCPSCHYEWSGKPR